MKEKNNNQTFNRVRAELKANGYQEKEVVSRIFRTLVCSLWDE